MPLFYLVLFGIHKAQANTQIAIRLILNRGGPIQNWGGPLADFHPGGPDGNIQNQNSVTTHHSLFTHPQRPVVR